MQHLLITVRWLDERYHGLLGREGRPEWPPSPFRLFQALVAGVARRNELDGDVGKSLEWLEGRSREQSPLILAPRVCAGQIVTHFVPNNDGDKKPDRQDRLTAKTSRPTVMLDLPQVHYLWPVTEEDIGKAHQVCQAAKYLTILGWGIDMAYADAQLINESEINTLSGVRWRPKPEAVRDVGMLRIPKAGSLEDLNRAHQSALDRIQHGKPLNSVVKPRVFESVFYESKERLLGRPHVVFELRNDNGTRFGYSQSRLIHLVGMLRHLAKELMEKSPPEGVANPDAWVRSYILGHRDAGSELHRQLSYLPLPSIGMEHTDPAVRRVMIASPLGDDRVLHHLAKVIGGQKLKPTPETNIAQPPTLVYTRDDRVARCYLESATEWASVTPVILPGHDDHKPEKTRKLIVKALEQSGVEQPCEFVWSAVPWFPKSLSAHKYDRNKKPTGYIRPDHLLGKTAIHLRLHFDDGLKVPGPLVIGAGRHCGFGLLASIVGQTKWHSCFA